uniref:Salivary histamine binding protein n=1 Tax=Ixodes scapularis TaxID=6945 RepID=Q4PMH0_IXOSC|nr:salivary histamine binding protein [Ixodes scapularis]
MKLVLSLAIFVCGVLSGTYGEMSTTPRPVGNQGSTSTTTRPGTPSARMITTTIPPEEDPSKYKEQNATRVVEMNATQWVKWRTYNVTEVFGSNSLECENFKVMGKRTPTNYSLQYRYRSENRWKTINETLILKDFKRRGFYNDMNFARTPIGIPTDNLVLYSNYMSCTILRIPFTNQGERHCDLWMANMTLSQETPDECLNRFFEYCNTTKIYRVFYPNCTNQYIHFSLK